MCIIIIIIVVGTGLANVWDDVGDGQLKQVPNKLAG